MSRKIKIRSFEQYACSPFCEYRFNNGIDVEFLLSLSRPTQNVLMYLAHKHDLEDEKFLFDPEEFNKFVGYRSSGNLTRGIAELCFKGLLAKNRSTFLYWVNNTLLNTEVSGGIITVDSVKVSLKIGY